MLRDVVSQRARDRILQQALVGDQPLAVDRFHLLRIKIHRYHADECEHTQDDVQNRDARWKGYFQDKVGQASAFCTAGGNSFLLKFYLVRAVRGARPKANVYY